MGLELHVKKKKKKREVIGGPDRPLPPFNLKQFYSKRSPHSSEKDFERKLAIERREGMEK
jgi:hypothetical protein